MSVPNRDRDAVHRQLRRAPRGLRRVAHRCACGLPDVIETAPRLEDGTPFPTTYYLTCPRAVAAVGTLESGGVMAAMTARLRDGRGAARALPARAPGLPRAAGLASRPCPSSPAPAPAACRERVKCLHVLVAHSLAAGPGSTRSATRRWRHSSPGAGAGRASTRTGINADARRGHRLRHQLDPPARRRRRARPTSDGGAAPWWTSTAGWRSSGSARASTAPGDWHPRRWSVRSPPVAPTPASSRAHGAERVRFVATSATRDADNRADFVAGVREILGVEPRS